MTSKKQKMNKCINILHICILLIFSSFELFSQGVVLVNQSKTMEKRELMATKRDAFRLALAQRKGDGLALEAAEIGLQENEIDKIFHLLLAVKNSELPEAQEVLAYGIRAESGPATDHFTLIFDKNVEWGAGLSAEGASKTGYAPIDALMREYDLWATQFSRRSENLSAVTIHAPVLYNMAAIAQKFTEVAGVKAVEVPEKDPSTVSKDIEVKRRNNGWLVKFFVKWNDCENGCKSAHSWLFLVEDQTNQVKFIQKTGDPIPDGLK